MTKLTLGYMKKLNERFFAQKLFFKNQVNYLFIKKNQINLFIFNVLQF